LLPVITVCRPVGALLIGLQKGRDYQRLKESESMTREVVFFDRVVQRVNFNSTEYDFFRLIAVPKKLYNIITWH